MDANAGSVRIVPAPRALKGAMLDLSRATYAEHRARQPWAFPDNGFDATVVPNHEAAFLHKGRNLSESPNAFVALAGDRFAGYVLLSAWARDDAPDMPFVGIDDIAVHPDFRGRGIGRALLRYVAKRAEDEGWDSLNAVIWNGNEGSRALFASEGFVPEYTRVRKGPERAGRDYPPEMKDAFVRTRPMPPWAWVLVFAALAVLLTQFGW